jgi:mannose-6-phosphate isomerase-like protein (cupin superfamily)
MRRLLVPAAALLLLLAGGGLDAESGAPPAEGHVFQPEEGDSLAFCEAPGLSVNIKVDSVTAGATQFAMGTAELKGSNTGSHDEQDEVIFIYEGRGRVLVGETWFPARPGTTMYVPRGTRHGFTSDGSAPLRFVWITAPQGLEKRFREAGVSSLSRCPPPSGDARR